MKMYENYLAKLLNATLSRKGFIRLMAASAALLVFSGRKGRRLLAASGKELQPRKKRPVKTEHDLVVAKGKDHERITRSAIDALGGIQRFVTKGDIVVVKPNIGWDRKPEQAANTNPVVVGTLVKMCFEAGAKVVKVFDNTCNDARRTYKNTGIYDAVKASGGTIYYVSDWKFYPARFPAGSLMDNWPLFRDAVECDCFINVPVAKSHGITGLTLSMKNLMGVCGGSRGAMHQKIDKKLVELTAFMQPDLTVIDACRILLRNGPTGGDLDDVRTTDTVIAGTDPVLADAYGATLFGIQPYDIGHIRLAAESGLGKSDISKARIKRITLS